MKPILVHLHIYYPHLYKELKECVLNITPHKFDLFVTMVEEHSEIISDIKETFPTAKIEIIENRGYDVGPFIHILNQVNLDDYDYVVKLHTKRDMPTGSIVNNYDCQGSKWRDWALSFLKGNSLKKCIKSFSSNKRLGIIGNFHLITTDNNENDEQAKYNSKILAEKLNLTSLNYSFIAGTMFIGKSILFKPLQQLKLNIMDFEIPDEKHSSGLSHSIERFIGLCVYAQGNIIKDVFSENIYQIICKMFFPFRKIRRFIYRKKINKNGEIVVRICKIPTSNFLWFIKKIFSIERTSLNKGVMNILFIKFNIHYKLSLKNRIEIYEKQLIATSKFWDDLWYIKQYNHRFNRIQALDYWYKKGWKKGEAPSPYINVKYCFKACEGINPIIAHQTNSLVFFPDNKNNFKSDNNLQKITEYLEYRKNRKAKSVIYTCITNDYDDIHELETYAYINYDWDYICFTDNENDIKAERVGIWQIRPLQYNKSDVSRNNRWHKMHPHILFPEYKDSIYIDANINILSDFLFNEIAKKI